MGGEGDKEEKPLGRVRRGRKRKGEEGEGGRDTEREGVGETQRKRAKPTERKATHTERDPQSKG